MRTDENGTFWPAFFAFAVCSYLLLENAFAEEDETGKKDSLLRHACDAVTMEVGVGYGFAASVEYQNLNLVS